MGIFPFNIPQWILQFTTRKWKIIFFLVFLSALFNAGLFFLIHGLKIDLNKSMNASLNKYGILVDITPVRTSFIPYPHLKIKKLYMNIDNETYLTFKDLKIDIDLWVLMMERKLMVKKIFILDTKIRIKGKIDHKIIEESKRFIRRGFYIEQGKVDHILKRIRHYIHMIPHQFDYTESLFASKADIIIEDINQEDAFIRANRIKLKNTSKDLLNISIDGRIQNWFNTNLRLEIFKNPKSSKNWINRINVYHKGKFDLDYFNNGLSGLKNIYAGDIGYYHAFTLSFPLKKIRHYGNFRLYNIQVKDGNKKDLITINSKNPLMIHFAGTADADKTLLPYFVIYYRKAVLTGSVEWVYKKFLVELKFEKGNIPYRYVNEIAPSSKLGFASVTSASSIGLKRFRYNPWTSHNEGLFDINFFLRPHNSKMMVQAYGRMRLYDSSFFSRVIRITGYNTDISMRNFQYYHNNRLIFNASGNLSSLWGFDNSRGYFNLNIQMDCMIYSYRIFCQKKPYQITGKKIYIPAGTASRFFRLMSVDFFSYWKSFKARSEVEIKRMNISGYIFDDVAHIKNSTIDSDIGFFRLNGYYNLMKADSKITVRFFPLNMDKFISKIPIIGVPFEKAMALTSEMILYFQMNPNGWHLNRFFIGRGLERLNTD